MGEEKQIALGGKGLKNYIRYKEKLHIYENVNGGNIEKRN